MIKLNISLAKFNGTGACASISDENDDDLLIYAAMGARSRRRVRCCRRTSA